ncbi:hypothetical protein [Streptomyces sp. NPDC002671]
MEPELVVEVGVDVARDASGRWRPPTRWHRARRQVTSGHGLEPGDATCLRFRSLNPQTADGQPLPPGPREREVERFLELQAMLAMYTAVPHFVPPDGAFDAATGPAARARGAAAAAAAGRGMPDLPRRRRAAGRHR